MQNEMTIEAAIIELNRLKVNGYMPVDVDRRDRAIEKAKAALSKQIPKKPLSGIDFMGNEFRICCDCSAIVRDGEWRANYCPDCGQALDWSDTDD